MVFKNLINKLMPKKNKGYLERPEAVGDYIAGASPIEYEVRNFSSNWDAYLGDGELQSQNGFETMSCVTQSALNSIETQINWMLMENKLTQATKDFLYNNGYLANNGKVNFSKRFTAIMSGTSPLGNYLTSVSQSIRDFGLLPETDLPFGSAKTWAEYYDQTAITEAMKTKALNFSKLGNYFNIQYEIIVSPTATAGKTVDEIAEIMLYHLRQSPIQIAALGHAREWYLGVDKVRFGEFDSYVPFLKEYKWTFNPNTVMKFVVTEKYMPETIAQAQTACKNIMANRKSPFFFRPEANGEAYLMDITGSFKYKKGLKCPLFDAFITEGYITPISETLWETIKIAEIK
jgi:hypothetical protein